MTLKIQLQRAAAEQLLGHEDLNTTAIYAHADAARGISPMDAPVMVRPQLTALAWA